MLFNSLHFLIFFPVVALLFFSLKQNHRWILLLAASYYFYMSWKVEYVLLIMFSTLVDYIVSIQMDKTRKQKIRKFLLGISITSNLGILFAFKYLNFVSDTVAQFFQAFSIPFTPFMLNVILPVGISFYTFQTLGYSIDVYRKKIKPERHLGIFALYVSFFPQLVAGPIERAKNLLPQLYNKISFEYTRVTNGIKLMLWGFFLKIVIADRLAITVNQVYNNVDQYTGIPLVVATVFFAFQIYGDFAGYSFIAIGAAQVLGYSLMDNFRRPYFAQSVAKFWRRWHISLTTWFKDYIYVPLGGNRVPVPRWYANIIIVFLISGIWHGANWTFIVWGILHGVYLIASLMTKTIREKVSNATGLTQLPRIRRLWKVLVTFILVNVGWIIFRANSLSDARYIFTHLFSGWTFNLRELAQIRLGLDVTGLIIAGGALLFMFIVHHLQEQIRMREFLSNKPIWIRWSIYLIMSFAILLFGVFGQNEFIYFQF